MFKKLLTATWMMFLFACCQLAAAAPSVIVTATPNNPAAPATVTLSVVVTTDAEPVTVTQVEYFSGATSLGVALQDPFALVLNGLAAGTYQITAKAYTTDSNNPVLQSPPVTLTVGAAPGAATAYFIHTDQLNTPRAISDAGGAMVWQWDSDPFGKDAANEQPAGQSTFSHNQRFPGQQFDRESNLHYNYYRDFDPSLGRYVQSDPIGLEGGINTFNYVLSNPLAYIDPFGLETTVDAAIRNAVVRGDIAELNTLMEVANPQQAQVIQRALTPARDLIRGATRRSASYASELEGSSYSEICKLAKGAGELANKAKKMKKLIEQQERLLGKL